MTYDELIAAGAWSDELLTVRSRASDYLVDGVRLGSIALETRSGSPHDVFMIKSKSEVAIAADLLARLKIHDVNLFTVDENGKILESPDLDCVIGDGERFGIEVAEVAATDSARHEAERNRIEMTLSDLIDSDPTFASALGNVDLTINLNKIGALKAAPLGKKQDIISMTSELEAFIRARAHLVPARNYYERFSAAYPILHAREAQFHSSPFDQGFIHIEDGPLPIVRKDEIPEVIRILDKHRGQATKYRDMPTWIVLALMGDWEIFHGTVAAVAKANLPIAPFLRAFVTDSIGRFVELPPGPVSA